MSGPPPPPPPGHSARKFTTGANAIDRGGHKRSTAVLRSGTTPMGPRECAGEPNGDAASVRAKPYSRPPERPPTRAAAPDYGAPPPPGRAYDPPDKRHNAALGDDYDNFFTRNTIKLTIKLTISRVRRFQNTQCSMAEGCRV